jgi:hypothetical protein
MRKSSPKHLEPRLPFWTTRIRLGSVAVVAALVLVLVVMVDEPDPLAAGSPAATVATVAPTTVTTSVPTTEPTTEPTTTTAAPAPPAGGGLLADPGFEAGLGGWRPLDGAGLRRMGSSRSGGWAAMLTAGRGAAPGMAVPSVTHCRVGATYAGELWVRGSRPGMPVEVRLLELVDGARYASDTVGVVLADTRWRRIEVLHTAHRTGARLSVEVVAPRLPGSGRLLIDDVRIHQGGGT